MSSYTLPPLAQATSGAFGSAMANALVYPLDLVATRAQLAHEARRKRKTVNGLMAIPAHVREIVKREGWGGLYDGLLSDTGATVLSNFLYFYLYTFLRSALLRRRTHASAPPRNGKKAPPPVLGVVDELGLGYVAGVLSRAISTPLNVVTVHLQTNSADEDDDGSKPRTFSDVIRTIYSERGLRGFWKGFEAVVVLALNPALTFSLIQLFQRISHRLPGKGLAANKASFLSGALANSIAVGLLYPLILAKTRLQSSTPAPRPPRRDTELKLDAPDSPSTTLVPRIAGEADAAAPSLSSSFVAPSESGLGDSTYSVLAAPEESLLLPQTAPGTSPTLTASPLPMSPESAQTLPATAQEVLTDAKDVLVGAVQRAVDAAPEEVKQVAETGMQVLDIWRDAYARHGARGLYQGLEVQLLKGFLSQGVTMMVKERVEQVVIALARRHLSAA